MTKMNSHHDEKRASRALRGYIEGYYGRMLTWDDRGAILDHLKSLGMGAYLYAPKEDICHRYAWRQDYDDDWVNNFQSFCNTARDGDIAVIAGIAPGLDYDFSDINNGEDWDHLLRKCQVMLDGGAQQIALLLDDIQPDFKEKSGRFSHEGDAHAALANALNTALADHMDSPIILTPRLYADEVMGHDLMASGADDETYWPRLAASLDEEIRLLVCGRYVVSHDTRLDETAMARAGMNKERAIIWDNLYAHDYCPRRLFLGRWQGRPQDQDILLNPTGLVETDKLLLSFMDAGMNTGMDAGAAENAWRAALAKHDVPEAFHVIAPFFDLPPDPEGENAEPDLKPEEMLAALDVLLWQWKSALQREWYPFLMGLRQDILLKTEAMNRLRQQKSLPPLLWPNESDDDV